MELGQPLQAAVASEVQRSNCMALVNHLDERIEELAEQLAHLLRSRPQRIVLAESCTGGRVAETLTRIPGISEFFCGSAVTYRNATKAAWLGVSISDLKNEQIGPVSEQVAGQMCRGVLDRTPEADVAAAVTGHLGPDAPPELDGVVYVAAGRRGLAPFIDRHRLPHHRPPMLTLRQHRQREATALVLLALLAVINDSSAPAG
jgi:PncC family amidohydrolase